MRGLTNLSVSGAFADVLKGKSKEELERIFGGEVPKDLQETLKPSEVGVEGTEKKDESTVRTIGGDYGSGQR
jgi:hypothetical protein